MVLVPPSPNVQLHEFGFKVEESLKVTNPEQVAKAPKLASGGETGA